MGFFTATQQKINNASTGAQDNTSISAPSSAPSKTPYQVNLQSTNTNNTNKYSLRNVLGMISTVYQKDKEKGNMYLGQLQWEMSQPTSQFYNPYSQPTNRAVSNLAALGFDTNNLNDDWFNANQGWISSNLSYTGTTNSPSKPGKKATYDQQVAYELYQWHKSEDTTKKAEQEWAALQDELSYWAKNGTRNYSDDYIIDHIDWSKYKTLASMDEDKYLQPTELNRGIGYSKDAMYGVLWAARNDYDGDILDAMANSGLGTGKQWTENPEIAAKLNWNDKNTYSPYSVGMTLKDEGVYFGLDSFGEEEINRLKNGLDPRTGEPLNPNDETAMTMLDNVLKADDTTIKAETELADLNERITSMINSNSSEKTILDQIERMLDECSTLRSMDTSLEKSEDNLLKTTRKIDYKHDDLINDVKRRIAERDGKETATEKVNNLANNPTGTAQTGAVGSPVDTGKGTSGIPSYDMTTSAGTVDTNGKPLKTPTDLVPGAAGAPALSQSDIQTIKADDAVVADSLSAVRGNLTSGEDAYFQNAASTGWDFMKNAFSYIRNNVERVRGIAQDNYNASMKSYVEDNLDAAFLVGNYNAVSDSLNEDNDKLLAYERKYGDLENYYTSVDEIENSEFLPEFDSTFELEFNHETNNFEVVGIKEQSTGMEYYHDTPYKEGSRGAELVKQAEALAEEKTKKARAIMNAQLLMKYYPEMRTDIEAYGTLKAQVEKEKNYVREHDLEYEEKSNAMASARAWLDRISAIGMVLGVGNATDREEADALIATLSEYYNQPDLPASELTPLQMINNVAEFSGTMQTWEEKSQKVHESIATIDEAIDFDEKLLDYIDRNGINVPDRIRKNIQYELEDYRNERQAFEYASILTDTPPKELEKAIEAGREFEEKYGSEMEAWDEIFKDETTAIDQYKTLGEKLRYMEADFIDDDDKRIYYYLLGKSVLANGAELEAAIENNDTYGIRDILDEKILKTSNDFVAFMDDDDYGVWTSRNRREVEEYSQAAVKSGVGGGIAANIAATFASPLESILSGVYMLDRAITGKRINPDTKYRIPSVMKEATRAETRASIQEKYGEGTFNSWLANLGYEIYCNRGDSLVNQLTLGSLFGGSGMLGEFKGSMPMGISAALNAAAEAVENGADVDQAWLIAGATFIAETATEAITYGNIKEALGTAKELSEESVKAFLREWLVKNGPEELTGEVVNNIVERTASLHVARYMNRDYESDRQRIVDKYIAQGKDPDEAEQFAKLDEFKDDVHTAIVSYLSAGTDVFVKAGKAAVNGFNYYRSATRSDQQLGGSRSMVRNMLEGVQQDTAPQAPTNKPVAVGKPAGVQAQQTTQNIEQENVQQTQTNVRQETAQQETENTNPNFEVTEVDFSELEKQYAQDIETIDSAINSADSSAISAGIAVAIGFDASDAGSDQANAAAIHAVNLFDNGAEGVSDILYGGFLAKVNAVALKSAIQYAALGGENSECYNLTQTEEFKNATPEQKAVMLARASVSDAVNPAVQQNVNAQVQENRLAEAMKAIMAKGSMAGTVKAQGDLSDAEAKNRQAQKDLSVRQDEVQAASDARENADQEVINDPANDDKVKEAQQARNKLESAVAVEQEYEQSAENAQKEQDKAEANLDSVRQKELAETRLQATADVEAKNQQRAEQQAQEAEQQRIADEQAAQAQAEEDERTGKAEEDRNNAIIEGIADSEHLEGEDRENRIAELKEQADKVKIRITDLSKPVSNTEGALAVYAFSRKLGIPIEFGDLGAVNGDKIVRGEYIYDERTGAAKIVLNQNLIKEGKMSVGQALVEAALHEAVHFMRKTGSYNTFRNVAVQSVFKTSGDVDTMTLYNNNADFRAKVDYLIEERKAVGDTNFIGKTHEQQIAAAEDEIVADFARMNLAEKDVVQRFMDAGLGGRMRNALHNINQALKNYFGNLTGEERQTAEYLRRAERAFQKAMIEAAKSDIHPNSSSFSVSQIAESMNIGMVVNNDTLELYMPSEKGNIVGNGKNGLDEGKRYVLIDGVTEGRKITPDMIVNTPVGMLIDMGLSNEEFTDEQGNIRTQQGDARQMFADLMNLCARYKDNNLIWEIAGSEFSEAFSALKSNSDPQYKNTVDFGTICSKTQAVVDVLSETMIDRVNKIRQWNAEHAAEIAAGTVEEKVFTGLDRTDIMEVYDRTHNAGLSVPCPVCYVFSRWMGVPGMLGQMNRFQHQYVALAKDADGNVLHDEKGDAVVDWDQTFEKANGYLQGMIREYTKTTNNPNGIDITDPNLTPEERQAAIKEAKDKIAKQKNSINGKIRNRQKNLPKLNEQLGVLQEKLERTDLTDKERQKTEKDIEKKKAAIKKNMADTDQLMEDIKEFEAFNWVSQVVCVQHTEGRSTINDLDENGNFVMDKENFRYTPEEILFDLNRSGEFAGYAKNWRYRTTRGAGMGKAIMPYSGASIGDIIHGDALRWKQSENPLLQMDRAAAETAWKNAKKRVKQQNLVGGQRFQSTSDFRPEWGLDYIMSFLEMQALGSKVQMYTKVAEAVDFLGSIGADVNLSIMAKNNGYHIATDAEIELAKQDTDEGREMKSRMGITTDENGESHLYVMEFSDVTGMDYDTAKGKTKKFNNVQMILVGMNDVHIRLALGNQDIDFVIPWHSSGNSKDVLQQLVSSVGEELLESSDYTDFQTDQIKSHKEGKGKSEKTIDDRTEDEIKLWDARVKLLTEGKEALTEEEIKTLMGNDITKELYKRFTEEGYDPDCFGVKLTKDQAEQVFPYEYWDKTSTRENADVNGERFVAYCDALGLVPRFSQFKDVPGYWKLLIDRKMYDNNVLDENGNVVQYGKYREQKVVDVTKARMDNDPDQALDPATERKQKVYQLPEETTARYGRKNYSEQTEAAIRASSEYLSEKYDVKEQRSELGDLTEADRDLMSDEDLDKWFDDYLDGLSSEELDKLAQEMFGVSLKSPSEARANAESIEQQETEDEDISYLFENVNESYKEAIDRGDYATARKIIDKLAERAGYTFFGSHRTNAEFTVFDRSKQSGTHGKSMGDGFYIAKGEGSEYDHDYYGKNKMLLYVKPGNSFNIQEQELTEQQANKVYDKYFAPHHSEAANAPDSPYRLHVLEKLRNGFQLMDYIKEAAEINDTTTDKIFKELGYDSIKDGPQLVVFDPEQIKLFDLTTYDDDGNAIPLSERFQTSNPDIRYSTEGDLSAADRDLMSESERELNQTLVNAGVITPEELAAYQEREASKPLEGMNPTMSTAQGTNVRAFAAESGMLQDADQVDRFAKAVVTAQNTYFPDTNEEQVIRAVKWIRSLKQTENSDGYYEALQKIASDDFDYRSADGQARMVAAMALANAKGDILGQTTLADAFMRQGTDLGRALQARKLFKLMTPEGRISTLMKTLNEYNTDLKSKGMKGDLKFSDWIIQAAAFADTQEDFRKVQMAAAAELAEKLPISWKERANSLRMLAMLGNPRTHIRNLVGNMLFVPAVGLKNKIGAVLELGVKKGERTKTLAPVLNSEIREFARQDARNIKDTLTGEAKYDEHGMVEKAKNPLGPVLGKLSDFNSWALEGEDWLFLRGHYRRALGSWMQANGYTVEQVTSDKKLLEKGREYAIQEAQKATYRDFNGVAQRLNQLARNPETKGEKTLAFITNAVLPFKKTPANILKRGIEYSPIGVASSVYNLGRMFIKGDVSATSVIDQFASGLAGTSVMALGFLLAGTGAVSCGFDDDDWVEELKGKQKYSINPGKAANAVANLFGIPKLFGEDVTYTLDWAAPMSMPLFVGASIRNQADEEGWDFSKTLDAILSISEPVFNLSMLDGVNSLLKVNSYSNENPFVQIGAKIVSNYATSYVSSLLGAITRTFFDDTQRKSFVTKGENTGITGTFRYAWESAENKLPGVSKTNIPVRDVWGREKTDAFAERLIENLISPGYIEHYEEDPVVNELGRLFDSTGSMDLAPEHAATSVKINKVTYNLGPQEFDTFDRVHGETQYSMLNELVNNESYQKLTDDDAKVEIINQIYSYANSVAKNALFPEYRYEKKNVADLVHDGVVTSYKSKMIQCLEEGNNEGFFTYVGALREENVEDTAIKEKISGTYRDQWKEAYRMYLETGDEQYSDQMDNIENILNSTGFEFKIYTKGGWMDKVNEEHESSGGSGGGRRPTSIPTRPASDSGWDQYMDDLDDYWANYDFSRNDPTETNYNGTIDLNDRQVVHNEDGSISTEYSFSFWDDDIGKEVLIPRVVNGRIVSEQEAKNHYYKTGEHLGMFDDWHDADEYAMMLHNRNNWYYNR